jgi:hypothetical protein
VGTLVTALVIWFGERQEEWEGRLPKKMRVCFLYPAEEGAVWGNRAAIVVENIPLAGEAEIRSFAQNIGRQVAGGKNLDLSPLQYLAPPYTDVEANCRLYEFYVQLRSTRESGKKDCPGMPYFNDYLLNWWDVQTMPEVARIKTTLNVVRNPGSVVSFGWPDTGRIRSEAANRGDTGEVAAIDV